MDKIIAQTSPIVGDTSQFSGGYGGVSSKPKKKKKKGYSGVVGSGPTLAK